jgi:hypothetical protein
VSWPTWSANRAVRPLPADRPLWRAEVVDDLPDGWFAIIIVVHHLVADGLAGMRLAVSLLDAGPEVVVPVVSVAPAGSMVGLLMSQRELVRAQLADLVRSGHALDVTVNDLLPAAVTGGLRALLSGRGEDAAGMVLRATVPAATGRAGQVLGMLVVDLPVGEPDPSRCLALIHRSTSVGKARLPASGGDVPDLAWQDAGWGRRHIC